MKKIIAVLIIAAMLSGCTGSFVATKKVYQFHRNMENKWLDELVFIIVAYVPVYALAILGDAIIFNTIEFWTDENPLQARVVKDGDLKTIMAYDKDTGKVKITSYRSDKPITTFVLEKNSECVVLKDKNGEIVYTSRMDADGGISIRDINGKLVKYISPEEVKEKKETFS